MTIVAEVKPAEHYKKEDLVHDYVRRGHIPHQYYTPLVLYHLEHINNLTQ